jgi:hypothetical protein
MPTAEPRSRGPRGAPLALLVVPPFAIGRGLLLRDPAPDS